MSGMCYGGGEGNRGEVRMHVGGLVYPCCLWSSWCEPLEIYKTEMAYLFSVGSVGNWRWVESAILGGYLVWECYLKSVFPELYGISQDKGTAVADLMNNPNGFLQWDFYFIRPVQDWELESLSNFMEFNLLYFIKWSWA